jgi:hypothetical protein
VYPFLKEKKRLQPPGGHGEHIDRCAKRGGINAVYRTGNHMINAELKVSDMTYEQI